MENEDKCEAGINNTSEMRIARALEAALVVWKEERDILNQLLDEVRLIHRDLNKSRKPVKMQLQFKGEKIGMPGQETDTQTIPCTAIETDAADNPVTLNPANVTWGMDDPSIATLTQNPDGSATFKALKVGTANVTCTDNSVNPPLVGTDTLTVVGGPANKLVLQFGTAA